MWGLKSRTNNHVESHNAILGKAISEKSSFYTVIEKLAEDETKKAHDLLMLLEGKPVAKVHNKKKKKYLQNDKFIAERQAELEAGTVTYGGFLQALSYRFNPIHFNVASLDSNQIEENDVELFVRS